MDADQRSGETPDAAGVGDAVSNPSGRELGSSIADETLSHLAAPPDAAFVFDFRTYTPDQLPPNQGATYRLDSNPSREFEDPFDARNLKFYVEAELHQLVRELEVFELETRHLEIKPLIVAVIGTGGTIAMVKENGQLVPRLDAETLLNELPGSKRDRFRAASIQLPEMIDSACMPPDVTADTVVLMSAAWNEMSPELQERFGGFVITHGTDTMEDSAAFSRMMLGPNVPFNTGIVGAQKTLEDRVNDISANVVGVLTSLEMAHENPEIKASHHLVFMNGTSGWAMTQVGLEKVKDGEIKAFVTPIHHPLLALSNFARDGLRVVEANRYQEGVEFRPLIVRGNIEVERVKAAYGRDPRKDRAVILAAASVAPLEGIVVTTYGAFTLHPQNLRAIKEAADQLGVPSFVSNPFPDGSIDHRYGPAVAIRASGMEPVKLMSAALSAKIHVGRAMFGDDREAFLRFIRTDYVGEFGDNHRPMGPSPMKPFN